MQPIKEFQLENRYIVAKRSKLDVSTEGEIEHALAAYEGSTPNCLVVEEDWDIYPQVLELVKDLYRRDQVKARHRKIAEQAAKERYKVLWDNGQRLYRMQAVDRDNLPVQRFITAATPGEADEIALSYCRRLGTSLVSVSVVNDISPLGDH